MCFGTMLFLECWPLEDPIRSGSGSLSFTRSVSLFVPVSVLIFKGSEFGPCAYQLKG